MIHIADSVKKIKKFLEEKGEEKYKIFIRINFCIDIYVQTSNFGKAQKYQDEIMDYLKNGSNAGDELHKDDFYKTQGSSLRINFEIVTPEDCIGDSYYENMFSDTTNRIDWGPRYRFESLLRTKGSNILNVTKNKQVPVITFYSYKGGMGRTTAMVAYAMDLAINKNKKVVVVDCDLEAPGYLNFFDLSKHDGLKSGKKNGLVEFFCDAQFTSNPQNLNIDNYLVNVGYDNQEQDAYKNFSNILLVPAGNLNEGYREVDDDNGMNRNDYLEGLAKINLSSVQTIVGNFNLLFEKIIEKYSPDIILLDSRTGFNDIFGTAAIYMSTCVVGFFGFSRQTQPGLINLLKDYCNPSNQFKLHLVFSIIPENATDEWVDKKKKETMDYISYIIPVNIDYPFFFYLHRNSLLEKIGSGDNESDIAFVNLIKNKAFKDYNSLFERINEQYFRKEVVPNRYTSNTPAITLRNTVLMHLKEALANVKNFAEDTNINEQQFFYRKCMKELFEPKKFLIRGYKGTGKTYLYKALADARISANMQEWAGVKEADRFETIFVNILPTYQTELVFSNIHYGGIEEPDYYFKVFWQIYTWNNLLLNPEFIEIKNNSELRDYVKPLEGVGDAIDALSRIEELINRGVYTLSIIAKDIKSINQFLAENKKKLFILYDRLDTCINPLRWDKAVSPLINYWWENYESFSNITPKIFVRTDLFRQIEGTNTARLEANIISIEWSIGEVFGFFFKLIFSNVDASNAYWAIAEKVGIGSEYINNTKKSFAKFPYNQFKSLTKAEMSHIIRVFFGNEVRGTSSLGTPWEYFDRELAIADENETAKSLRPFINTLDSNAVDVALASAERYVQNGIISPDIYASPSVREKTTDTYFEDLARDPFSKDLMRFRDVIRSNKVKFGKKTLNQEEYNELMRITFERIIESNSVRSTEDLKRLIEANGIMAKKPTNRGNYYRFAPIYWYGWGLVNTDFEKNERKESKRVKQNEGVNEKKAQNTNTFVAGEEYEGVVVEPTKYGDRKNKIKCDVLPYAIEMRGANIHDFYPDEVVLFTAGEETNWNDTSKKYKYAYNVRLKE